MSQICNLLPSKLWKYFDEINAIPRASKKEERIIKYIQDFGNSRGLKTMTDEVGNVVITKNASKGNEDKETIVLQSHLDMVHQKNNDVNFDFDREGIRMVIEGDWVKAEGTTLGADNGIGVASILAILDSNDIDHPTIEALFTIDEETGMTGALSLKPGFLSGKILLNLDTEEDDEIDIGCAGGIDVTATKSYSTVTIPALYKGYQITVSGLNGGHSGMDIHKGLGNANKIMNRILFTLSLEMGIMIHSINGGSLRNAIPRESQCLFGLHADSASELNKCFDQIKNQIILEYKSLESKLTIDLKEVDNPGTAIDPIDEIRMLKSIYAAPNGVFRMSPEILDLVEASNNIARVEIGNGEAKVLCLSRSSVESSKTDVVKAITSAFELGGFEVEATGGYPGWAPNPDSAILAIASEVYEKLNESKPNVVACHAGLECGIIGSHYPGLDMISFGPNIKGAHSPDEKVSISSVQKYWKFLLEVLKSIPNKK